MKENLEEIRVFNKCQINFSLKCFFYILIKNSLKPTHVNFQVSKKLSCLCRDLIGHTLQQTHTQEATYITFGRVKIFSIKLSYFSNTLYISISIKLICWNFERIFFMFITILFTSKTFNKIHKIEEAKQWGNKMDYYFLIFFDPQIRFLFIL